MPTGPSSDVVPVRKATKRRLARLKGSASYDAIIARLLDALPEGARLEPPGPAKAERAREPRERPPEKQLLIADLAARRWRTWLEEGRAVQLGPRLYSWKTRPATRRTVRYDFPRRRGIAP